MFKNKFFLGLITALILGIFFNIINGYFKFGFFNKFLTSLGKKQENIDKDVKECKNLVPSASSFGNLKVTILGNGKPVPNLEVDLSDKPGPNRCMLKTDNQGSITFKNVPAGRMAIYFNSADFPKEFGNQTPVEYIQITKDQTTEKIIELKK